MSREIEAREGFLVTTPLRTLIDAAVSTTVSDEQLTKAVEDAEQRGLVSTSVLKKGIARVSRASRLARVLANRR